MAGEDVGYVFRRDHQDSWGKLVIDYSDDVYVAFTRRVDAHEGPYILSSRAHAPYKPFRNRESAMDRAVIMLRREEIGAKVKVESTKTGDVAWGRKVGLLPPMNLPNATPEIDVIVNALRLTFPAHHNLGWFNCRRIDGLDVYSQHAWGGAYDAGGSLDLVCEMGDFLVVQARKSKLPIGKVIYNRRAWNVGEGFIPYTGSDPHTGHLHVEGLKNFTGTPPCAKAA